MQAKSHRRFPEILAPKQRYFFALLVILVSLLGLVGAAGIPFYFESATLFYKFGFDKLLLRAAQVAGIVAGYLLTLQIILGARLKIFDRIFGLSNLFRFHRFAGYIIAGLVIVHPVLIFISDNRITIPFQWRYWPEFVGLFLAVSIIGMVFSSQWRAWLRLPFHRWWPIHRTVAIMIAATFWVHLLNVSETFQKGIPRMAAFLLIVLSALLFVWIRTRRLRNKKAILTVSEIESAGKDALRIEVNSDTHRIPAHQPGQFGFLTCVSPNISREEHPFTIASSPTAANALEFVIRTTGDWTVQLDDLKPGDQVILDGPYGLFSHTGLPSDIEVVMVAGGIGITPMLSMLRYMADHGDPRKVTLIWSNRTREHIILTPELEKLADRLPGLRIFHALTREPGATAENGRLDQARLKKFTSDCSKTSAVFVCGPDRMMTDTCAVLDALGFERRMIAVERFSL